VSPVTALDDYVNTAAIWAERSQATNIIQRLRPLALILLLRKTGLSHDWLALLNSSAMGADRVRGGTSRVAAVNETEKKFNTSHPEHLVGAVRYPGIVARCRDCASLLLGTTIHSVRAVFVEKSHEFRASPVDSGSH